MVSTKVVVSTSLRCRLRLANVTNNPQVGNSLRQALPGYGSALEGDVNVNSFGPFLICTMINATFSDTSEFNPTEKETCRVMTRI